MILQILPNARQIMRNLYPAPAEIKDGHISAKLPADRPLVYYLTATDKRGVIVSTVHEVLGK